MTQAEKVDAEYELIKKQVEDVCAARMENAFVGAGAAELSKLLAMDCMEKAMKKIADDLHDIRWKVTMDESDPAILRCKVTMPMPLYMLPLDLSQPYEGVQYAAEAVRAHAEYPIGEPGSYCASAAHVEAADEMRTIIHHPAVEGPKGYTVHRATASFPPMAPYPLSLDLEETPKLPDLLPEAPCMPMPDEAKRLFTPAELVSFKTTELYNAMSIMGNQKLPECYLCARKASTLRVKNGGMTVCYPCALEHLGTP